MDDQSNEKQRIQNLLLSDYQFLQDYEIIEFDSGESESFLGKIKDSTQMVKFTKRIYEKQLLGRFEAEHELFKNGIILADNIFILEECDNLYFYTIEAYLEDDSSRFKTLQQYIAQNQLSIEKKTDLLKKTKILVDCVHQSGQPYAGLNSSQIIIDEEENLYLAPFSLHFELDQNYYQRSYYSPQILEMIHLQKFEVSHQILLKWDIWSFGCIALEILQYLSPVFMSSSIEKQLSLVKNFKIQDLIKDLEPQFPSLVKNALSLNYQNRKIIDESLFKTSLSQQVHQTAQKSFNDTNNISNFDLRTQIKEVTSQKPQTPILIPKESQSKQLRQLNIHSNQEIGDCKLVINLFTISNIDFVNELHITIYLNKKYHFFIEASDQKQKSYRLNRKLTFSCNFKQMQSYLSTPIIIQLKQDNKTSKIRINLQTLIIFDEGKRIWEKPLIGTYTTGSDGSFKQSKIKLSCSLKTPENIENIEEKVMISLQNPKADTKQQKHVLKQQNLNQTSNKSAKGIEKTPTHGNIKSIMQISQSLNNLTEHWKKKQLIQQSKLEQNRQKLSKLILSD